MALCHLIILCNLQHTETELHERKITDIFIMEYKYHHIIIKDMKVGFTFTRMESKHVLLETILKMSFQTVSKNPVLISLSIKNFMSPSSESWEGYNTININNKSKSEVKVKLSSP